MDGSRTAVGGSDVEAVVFRGHADNVEVRCVGRWVV